MGRKKAKRPRPSQGKIIKGVFVPSKSFRLAVRRLKKNVDSDIIKAKKAKTPKAKTKFRKSALARFTKFNKKQGL